MRCGRDCSGSRPQLTFWSFEDENSLPAEMSSDCVNYMSGHIDTKYLDQAFWFHGWMTASQSPKSVTSATSQVKLTPSTSSRSKEGKKVGCDLVNLRFLVCKYTNVCFGKASFILTS